MKNNMAHIAYQRVYGLVFGLMSEMFVDWPVDFPPNMIVLNRRDKDTNPNDPRGQITLGEMVTGYNPPPSADIGTMFPYWSVIRMYHPGVVWALKEHFNGYLTCTAGIWYIAGNILHEFVHFLTMARKYFRMREATAVDKKFLSELCEHHVMHRLGSIPDEYQTERLTVQILTAMILGRTHMSLESLYDGTALLPIPNGQFFHSFIEQMKEKDEENSYQAALIAQYRYNAMELAFGDPKLETQHMDDQAMVIHQLTESAKARHERYKKTWTLYDSTTTERSKWLT